MSRIGFSPPVFSARPARIGLGFPVRPLYGEGDERETGAFVSCVVDYTGSGVTIVFGAPTPNSWSENAAVVAGSLPTLIVNGLGATITMLTTIGDTALTVSAQLQGRVYLNDTVTLTGDAGWITDNSGVDETGAMSAETVTNNSLQLQDEV